MERTTREANSFAESFCKNRPRYCRFTMSFVRNVHVAEEIVDESFARFWEKRRERSDGNIEAYFYTILKNMSLNWLRDRQRQMSIRNRIYDKNFRLLQYETRSLDAYDPTHVYRNEIRDIMQRVLSRMPEMRRAIFNDSRFSKITYEEIAKKHGISLFKVIREIKAVTDILRIALKDYLPSIPGIVTLVLSLHFL